MPTKKIAQKIFVLDTNVILNNANSIFHYPNAEIIIPLCVINKLDDFKKLLNSVGRHARLFLEKIEEFQKQVRNFSNSGEKSYRRIKSSSIP